MRKEEFVTLPLPVQDYLNYLLGVKNKSELTVLEYASDLRLFSRFCARRHNPSLNTLPFDETEIFSLDIVFFAKLRLTDAYAFLSYCKDERKDEASARARKVTSIKRFYKYLETQALINDSPMKNLESPKLKKSLPRYLTLEQATTLLASVDGKNRERDYCILTLFLNCGMRLSELVSINLSDFTDSGTLVVTGKGNKERTVYINASCAAAINAYLRVRPVDGVADKEALFLSSHKKRISPKTVQHLVNTYLEKAGLSGYGFSTHKLRHTAATLMYQHGGVDVLLLKEILGHENLSTTEIYTHIVSDQLRAAIDSNPLNALASPEDDSSEKR
ncbi:MAG: tyrosine recombinase XerC [Clostridia bacterium]|nr:tyrosine recombinase XerC [Clostridia bacterium]